jgi:uncharacterized protein (DUF697 family)
MTGPIDRPTTPPVAPDLQTQDPALGDDKKTRGTQYNVRFTTAGSTGGVFASSGSAPVIPPPGGSYNVDGALTALDSFADLALLFHEVSKMARTSQREESFSLQLMIMNKLKEAADKKDDAAGKMMTGAILNLGFSIASVAIDIACNVFSCILAGAKAVKAAGEMPKEVAKQVGQKVCQELTKEISKQLTKKLAEKVTEKISSELADKIGQRMTQEVADSLTKEISKEIGKELAKELGGEVSEEMMEKITKMVGEEVSTFVGKEITEEMAEEIGKKVMDKVGPSLSQELGDTLFSKVSRETINTALQDTYEKAYAKTSDKLPDSMRRKMARDATDNMAGKIKEQLLGIIGPGDISVGDQLSDIIGPEEISLKLQKIMERPSDGGPSVFDGLQKTAIKDALATKPDKLLQSIGFNMSTFFKKGMENFSKILENPQNLKALSEITKQFGAGTDQIVGQAGAKQSEAEGDRIQAEAEGSRTQKQRTDDLVSDLNETMRTIRAKLAEMLQERQKAMDAASKI